MHQKATGATESFRLKVVMEQTLDGTLQDGTKTKAFCLGSLRQLLTEMPGDAAHKGNLHVREAIGTDVIAKEVAEIVNHQTLDGRV